MDAGAPGRHQGAAGPEGRRNLAPALHQAPGFHPTDFDVIFLALPAGVAAYSIERGTMDPLCAHDCFAARAYLFPYVHPPCPVQIPAIQPSPMQ